MKKFKKVYVEITNACNLSCHFCHKTNRPTIFMKSGMFEKIASEIKNYTDYVYLHVMGEPLLHPELGDFVDICSEYGLTVNITTNGTLINQWADVLAFKENIRQINFSLHSLLYFNDTSIYYDQEKYMKNIFDFIKMKKSNAKMYISLRLWNQQSTYQYDKCSAEDCNNSNKPILDIICKELDIDKLAQVSSKIGDMLYLNIAPQFIWPDKKGEVILENGFCYGLRTHVGILADGRVVPCCLDSEGEMSLGSMNIEKFGDIIESESANNIKSGFLQRKFVHELCKTCGYAESMNRKK